MAKNLPLIIEDRTGDIWFRTGGEDVFYYLPSFAGNRSLPETTGKIRTSGSQFKTTEEDGYAYVSKDGGTTWSSVLTRPAYYLTNIAIERYYGISGKHFETKKKKKKTRIVVSATVSVTYDLEDYNEGSSVEDAIAWETRNRGRADEKIEIRNMVDDSDARVTFTARAV